MGVSDWNKGWDNLQDGPYHYNTKLNIPNNVNLVVSNGYIPTQSKPTQLTRKTNHPQAHITPADTIVLYSGTRCMYFIATAPFDNINKASHQIRVGIASGELAYASHSAQLGLPQMMSYFPKSGHVIPAFNHSIMGSGSICDTECSVYFHKHTVTMYDLKGRLLLQVWKDNTGAKLWRFSLCPQNSTPFATE